MFIKKGHQLSPYFIMRLLCSQVTSQCALPPELGLPLSSFHHFLWINCPKSGTLPPKGWEEKPKQVVCNQGLKITQGSRGCIPCFPGHLSHFQFYRINLLAQTPEETQGLSLCLFQGPRGEGEGWTVAGRAQISRLFFLCPSPPPALRPRHETWHPGVSLGWVWTRLAHLSLRGGRIWLIRTSCVAGGFHPAPPLPLL